MKLKKVYVALPHKRNNETIFGVIEMAIKMAEQYTHTTHEILDDILSFEYVGVSNVQNADVIIADVSNSDPNVLFELGIAAGLNKPAILIKDRYDDSFFVEALHSYRMKLYSPRTLRNELMPNLVDDIAIAINQPESHNWNVISSESLSDKPSVFVSYSHSDSKYLERFRVHTKPLEKNGLVKIWTDRNIKTGDKWKEEISDALSRAAIAVLMVSADFLSSDFIVDNELPPILKSAVEGGTRILPVILKPCRFTRVPILSDFQALNDPKRPLLQLPEIEQEEMWDQLSLEIEAELESKTGSRP